MNICRSRVLLFLVLIALPLLGRANQLLSHSVHSMLFEVIENGQLSSKRVSLDIDAIDKHGTLWAECRITVMSINAQKKHVELDTYYCSTDQSTITNLKIDADRMSFDMNPFPLAPDRPLHMVVIREKENQYRGNATGLWTGLWAAKEVVKIEWRQVPSIELPFATVAR